MERVELTVQRRTGLKKGPAGRLRKDQCIPGVIYGKQFKNVNIQIDNRNTMVLKKINFSENTLINLMIKDEDAKLSVLIKDCQIHPLTEEVVHIDFINVSLKDKIKVKVPIRVKGEAEGVKEGGMLQYLTKELDVECIPTEIPESIEIDVTALKVGDSVHASDVKFPAGIRLLNPESDVIISLVMPEEEQEEVAPAEGASAEPEVIKEKPKTEEGEEEAKSGEGKAKEAKATEGKPEEPAQDKEKGKEKGREREKGRGKEKEKR